MNLRPFLVGLMLLLAGGVSQLAYADPPAQAPVLPSVESVVEANAGHGDTAAFTVTGSAQLPMPALLAVAYCRVQRERELRGFDGWYAIQVMNVFGSPAGTTQSVTVVVGLFHGEPPRPRTAVTKDWCAELQEAPSAAATR